MNDRSPGSADRSEAGFGWAADEVTFRYANAPEPAVTRLSVEIRPATCTAVLGPNGSGKSTLMRLLLGVLAPEEGEIRLAGRPLRHWSRRELARTIGVVPQDEEISFPLVVRDLVAMGRYPHLGPLRAEQDLDRAAIESAMERCDVLSLRDRLVQTLSGGERQRARLARALAQQPRMLALDEPTRALDVRHEMEILELLRKLVGDGVTVLLVTHNLNLAARYADDLLLLDGGRLAAAGPPTAVLLKDRLQHIYGWPLTITAHPGPGRDAGAIQVTPLSGDAQIPTHSPRRES